jgi:ATP phosphoribosyltransferase regulatory subunit
MTSVERWMLPDGIEEILPPEAHQVDRLRRNLVGLFTRWGYELVIPPMMEFTDSLIVGLGKDVDLSTFKVTDQLSGRSLGIRADITPQIARIDAHSLKRSGVTRLCYSGHVLKTRMKGVLDSRNPMQVGVELFGWSGLDADTEIISLMLDTFAHANVDGLCLDLGHVGIYRALAEKAGLSSVDEMVFFDLMQSKALVEVNAWVAANISDEQMAKWFLALPRLFGPRQSLDWAREVFQGAPDEVFAAIDELEAVADVISLRFPGVQLHFDLSELAGYHYLTGLVFAVFALGRGDAVARGGRYDHIGEVFGRARSAIGFTADLVALSRLGGELAVSRPGIFAPVSDDPRQWLAIQSLRAGDEIVIVGIAGQEKPDDDQNCDRILYEQCGQYVVSKLTD